MTRDATTPARPTRRRGRWVAAPLCAAGAAAAVLAPGATAFAASPHTPSPAATPRTSPGRPWAGDHAVQQAVRQLTGAGLPGAIALIQDHGRTAMAAAGYADLATKRPMTTADHLRIGSNTKAFTATLVLQLVAEGRLGLDDTAQQFLPGIIKGGDHIAVRQLLNHTSGLYPFEQDPAFAGPYLQGNAGYYRSPRHLVALANAHAPLFKPGTKFSYSNTNYILLGLIIEKITHHSYKQELNRRIIQPLRLRDTQLPVRSLKVPEPAAHGYLLGQSSRAPRDITSAISPSTTWSAGALTSTVNDLTRFDRALVTGKLLPKAQLNEMMKAGPYKVDPTDPTKGYGLGLEKVRLCGVTMWGHTGTVLGTQTNAFTNADGTRQLVLTTNADPDTWNAGQVSAWLTTARHTLCVNNPHDGGHFLSRRDHHQKPHTTSSHNGRIHGPRTHRANGQPTTS
ncbi:serine hydrolase domain-containing protein [Streptomyces sp. NPDC101149]|uniref:serine hydrolase domain-containing protein n=1 Tax=Streptomyces sp. NPDC101149 TaxID=3366113 RepID=UPI00382D8B36